MISDTAATQDLPLQSPSISDTTMVLSVIVPARNEADCLGDCLRSLVAQSDVGFVLGQDWELVVVDDHSADATCRIATSFAGVSVLNAPDLTDGWTGKANAVWAGAKQAHGEWLLFTDADTVHEPGNLRRALHEAQRAKVSLLSYSPKQIVQGFWQRVLMPLIYAELAVKYPPQMVNNPASPIAAANGQFLLIERQAYSRIGGHEAIKSAVLEDVELARRAKRAKIGLRFRYAPDAVSARMYRSFGAMYEGWTKNLALLFPNAPLLAFWKLLEFTLLVALPFLASWLIIPVQRIAVMLWWFWRLGVHYTRASRAHFSVLDTLLSPLGLPLFAWLLVRSWLHRNLRKQVSWKGRIYATPVK
ncbi:MAG TPA: glycosyltransferase family 2 protein [Acidobacteriaceae bacterium]|jgi:glycosyltransferase involved in cell wall biosynthesis|nr:glycosyltransferase family 2 protein [Acidobacteriaceae bacterium]